MLPGDVSVSINEGGETKLLNKLYVKNPSVVHGNGPSKLILNNFGNYLAGAFVDGECVSCVENNIPEEKQKSFTVLIALFVEFPTPFLEEFLDKILALNYPKNKIHLFIHNNVEYHAPLVDHYLEHTSNMDEKFLSVKGLNFKDGISEATARELAVNRCLTKKCDYLFVVDSDVQLENLDTLIELIMFNKSILAPVVTRVGGVWSNFWGAIGEKGFYARSSDYMSIVNNEIRGIWNVPFISSCYLIKSKILNKLSYTKAEVDADMAFAEHLRNHGIFMFASNLNEYGHLINPDAYDIKRTRPEFYELFTNRFDWERRFIREDYYPQLLEETKPKQPCTDVYWFPIATEAFTESMIAIMENFGKWSDGSNSDQRLQGGYEAVPTRDIHMNQVGLDAIWLKFLQLFVKPLQEKVFTGYFHDPPRSLMNFVVRYRPEEQPSLRPHHDSSTYTINLALNKAGIDYEGGGCRFIR
jgi:procollagen-lysine,2-oxoglutarate 5-dioxygenase, invertebrate